RRHTRSKRDWSSDVCSSDLVFFLIALLFAAFPARLVDNIGKILAPALVILLTIMLVLAFINPMGPIQGPEQAYQTGAFTTGFLRSEERRVGKECRTRTDTSY